METTEATNGKKNSRIKTPPDGWKSWPTVREVAKRLGCVRQHVYRLEKRGELRSVVAIDNGREVRRFDPLMVDAVAADEMPLGFYGADDDDDDAAPASGDASDTTRLLTRLLAEARQIAIDARRGQHEAYSLTSKPSQEHVSLLLASLEHAYKRIHDLEEQINKLHDEQRAERREDREFIMMQRQIENEDARKEQFIKLLIESAPVVVNQWLETLKAKGGTGPLHDFLRSATPEQQSMLVGALKAITAEENEAAAEPGEKANTNADPSS